jgi:hypothetical protein
MENDSIRASGGDTLVDIWVDGKLRAICVTREAILSFVGAEDASATTEDARCEFVRTHLPQVVRAAKLKLRDENATADAVTLDAKDLGDSRDRRTRDRRRSNRLKPTQNADKLRHGERRRSDRRKTDRSVSPEAGK